MNQEKHPLVSVITPSFNQAAYIRETIESVLAQDYPRIEHIVVDGGSTDGTLEILQSYAHLGDRLRYVSEPDNGQSHAINKGLGMAKGSIIGWLNSDDTYMPGAVRKVVDAFLQEPGHGVIYGNANYIDQAGHVLRSYLVEPYDANRLFETCMICQPAAFIRKDVFVSMGGVDESLRFCMDYDLWIRISRQHSLKYIGELLATSRLHGESKSVTQWSDVGLPEIMLTSLKHYGSISNSFLYEFLRVKGSDGASWLLQRMQEASILGESPHVLHMNRFHDQWTPRRFRIVITSDPANPVRRLRVFGSHMIPFLRRKRRKGRLRFTLYVNGRRIRRYALRKGAFMLDIPIQNNGSHGVVDFIFSTRFVPARARMSRDKRVLSCIVNEVIPFSEKESEFYRIMTVQPWQAGPWLQQHVTRRG